MTDYLRIPTFAQGGAVHVVVESPQGANAKLKFDTQLGTFLYSRPLLAGLTYPFDWGFVPSTCGEDGDPLDGMILNDHPTGTGVVVRCRVLGVLEVSQTEDGVTERNDRFLFKPTKAPRLARIEDVADLSPADRSELEQFFLDATFSTGKTLKFQGWRNAKTALARLKRGAKMFAKR